MGYKERERAFSKKLIERERERERGGERLAYKEREKVALREREQLVRN